MKEKLYPNNQIDFNKQFSNEQMCWDYLCKIRWPEGFKCSCCGGTKAWRNIRKYIECKSCGYQTSITSGTVLEGTRKSLAEWLFAMWWICTQKTGGSAKGLQKLLELGSYRTAWTWLHKLRVAMVRSDREPLSGKVEIDDGFIGGEEHGTKGRQTLKKSKFVLGIEIPDESRSHVGRIRIKHIEDFSEKSLLLFIGANVSKGSSITTDGWKGYSNLKKKGYDHTVIVGEPEELPNVHRSISLLKRWLLGTHQGAVQSKHLQSYFDEFTFRYNRRRSKHVGKVFYRLVQGAMTTKAIGYKKLISIS